MYKMTNTKNKTTKKVVEKISVPVNLAFSELLEKTDNPWTEIPKFTTTTRIYDDFIKAVNHSRFFYKTEPLVSTVLDKLVEIGINDLVFSRNKLTENEYRVFIAIKPKLLEFAEQMATEYLLSGLVVPEVSYGSVDKDFIFSLGVKKYSSLVLPDSMWVRDPSTIKIYTSLLGDKPSYFVKVPDNVAYFIRSKGKYADGKEDKALYELLVKYYPEFVAEVLKGTREILLENSHILRRKYTSDNPYPIPYTSAALEALHHKRKLRRMDYSIIDKVISAIMHIKLGDKDFPITDSDEDNEYIAQIRNQLRMRGKNEDVLERIFQLITNHTVEINWIFPQTEALLNVEKYSDINQEILFGLGFPRVLITGEAQKSGTSDSEIATLSPLKTAEGFRRKILEIIKEICKEISKRNGFNSVPSVVFKSINLHKFQDFLNGLTRLYESAAISRTTLGNEFGYEFSAEVELLKSEMDTLREKGLPEFGATPNSKNSLLQEGQDPSSQPKSGDNSTGKTQKTSVNSQQKE
jgi:hypothetical protein